MLHFDNRSAFRQWLTDNAADHEGVWIIFDKGTKTGLTAQQALEEALCFGWIDGQMKRIDEKTYQKYFAPRTANSPWSEKNRGLFQILEDKGLATPLGCAVANAARADGRWNAAPPKKAGEAEIAKLKEALAPYDTALANYEKMSPSVQKTYAMHLTSTKSEETRQRRLQWIVERLEQNLKPM